MESSRGWPLSFHLPLTRTHISSLRYPDHKVRNAAPYKGDLGVGVELHALASILFKSPGSTQSKCHYNITIVSACCRGECHDLLNVSSWKVNSVKDML